MNKNLPLIKFLLLFWLFVPIKGLAQNEIKCSELIKHSEIETFSTVLSQKMNLEDVLKKSNSKYFKPYKADDLLKDNSEFWIKFSVINNTNKIQKYYLGTSKFDSINYYFLNTKGKVDLQRGGNLYPNKLKKLRYGHFSFADIELKPNDTVNCYIHVSTFKVPFFQFVPLQLTLHTEPYFQRAYGNTNTYNLIFFGIVVIMAFYNLALLFITRERSYLYYVGYNISILGYVFALSGTATNLFFSNASFQDNLVLFTGISALGFYILFSQTMLELKINYNKWYKILKITAITAALALIPTTLNWLNISIPICFALALIAYPVILTLTISLALKKNISATYFLIANVFYITLLMISILQMLGVLPTFIFGLQANVFVQIGVSIELTLFSLALGARIISIREKTLKESEERLSQFLEAIPIGVFVLDHHGKPHYSNKAANTLLREDSNHNDINSNELANFYMAYKAGSEGIYPTEELPIVKALSGVSSTVEDMELRYDDKVISLEVSAKPIYDENKKLISAIAVFQNISQRLAAKKQLEEYNQTLELKVEERTKEIRSQKEEIEKEKEKSDKLLLNILPEEIANELKENGKSDARLFNDVSVMFTDFVNFTKVSETLSPEELVHELDYCFQKIDEIITKEGLEKIKTIGDAYLCVCGLPLHQENHAQKVANAALKICTFMKEYEKQRRNKNLVHFEIRIGIHSGPVVAGIVGIKKFAYDIWGDTVNTASRMESTSEPGRINISASTYELVKNDFSCLYRGKVEAKNKGEIDMYFLN